MILSELRIRGVIIILSLRERTILEYLIENKNGYVSSKDLAKYLNVSDRTIRTDIKNLSTKVSKNVMEIKSKIGYGYQLDINDFKELSNLFKESENTNSENDFIEFDNPVDRQEYIIRELIFSKHKLTIDSLLNRLFISDSTLQSDFQKIRVILRKYELVLSNDVNEGLRIKGKESYAH